MSLIVDFYTNTDDPIVLNKTPISRFQKEMNPLGEINELTPYFEVKYSSDYDNINYARIGKFGKYYFVTKGLLPSNMYALYFSVDPLMSNKTAIENLTCVIKRTGKIEKPTYVQDEILPIEPSRMFVESYRFKNGVNPHLHTYGDTNSTLHHILLQTI